MSETLPLGYPRPGFGAQHPEASEFLAANAPLVEADFEWPNGDVVVARSYDIVQGVPDAIVQSVRCLVVAGGDHVVVCNNARGVAHLWPGGRREPGETFAETARREVLEETGWRLDLGSLEHVGWLYFGASPLAGPETPWPHPDIFHALFVGTASTREADDWTDTEGYELSSRLVHIDDVLDTITPDAVALPFVVAALHTLRHAGESTG